MAFHLLSRLSRFKDTVIILHKYRILPHFCPPNDANFMFHRWATAARPFCYKRDGEEDGGATVSCASVMKGKSDKAFDSAKGARSVLEICNQKRVIDIEIFPNEVLESKELLFELFEAWMDENGKSYPSEEEKLHRFEAFKRTLFIVHEGNSSHEVHCLGLTQFAALIPGVDPFL